MYGSSAAGLAANLGLTKEEAERLIELYFSTFPGIKDYVELTHRMAIENHYVFSPFYQRKMTYGAKPAFKGTAVYNGALRLGQNVRVQNASSSFGLHNFGLLNDAIKPLGGKGLCNVYDSFEMEALLETAAEVIELTYFHLEENPVNIFDWLDLPVTIDVEIGYNWGKTRHVKRGTSQEQVLQILKELRTSS